jgi:hypothetical protein
VRSVAASDGRTVTVREGGDPQGFPVLVISGTPGSSTPYEPHTRDAAERAQRKYDAIVQAALDVFAEQATQGSLDEIATRAGVANATLYRRFPSSERRTRVAARVRSLG